MRDNIFLKVDDSLIAKKVLVFSGPPVSSSAVTGLVQSQKWPIGFCPSSELVDNEEQDIYLWGGDGDFPYPLGDFPLPPVWTGL